MTAILMACFAAVVAVNRRMATGAVRSFGGTVVENSYVASQKFNGWLPQARAQRRLGWRDEATLAAGRPVGLALKDAKGAPLAGVVVTAGAPHPLGRAPDKPLALQAPATQSAGRSVGNGWATTGRWRGSPCH